jgi:hypothetical protein
MLSSSLAKVGFCAYAASTLAVPSLAAGSKPIERERVIAIHKTLWTIYRKQENLEAFLEETILLESLTKDPEIPKVTGKELLMARRYREALGYLRRAQQLDANPDDFDSDIARCLLALNQRPEAMKLYEKLQAKALALEAKKNPGLPLPRLLESGSTWKTPTEKMVPARFSMVAGQGRSMMPVAAMPARSGWLSVTIDHCDFKIIHQKRPDVLMIANYPDHWADKAGSITQVGSSSYPPGHFHTINGNESWVGAGVNLSGDCILINGQLFEKGPASIDGSVVYDCDENGRLRINKKPVHSGALDPKNKEEQDIVQLIIPDDYVGVLELRTSCDIKADYWLGSINLFAGHPATFNIKSVSSGSVLDIKAGGYAQLITEDVRAKQLSVEARQKSILRIHHVDTSLAKLSAIDDAAITITAGKIETIQTEGSDEQIVLPDLISKRRVRKNDK